MGGRVDSNEVIVSFDDERGADLEVDGGTFLIVNVRARVGEVGHYVVVWWGDGLYAESVGDERVMRVLSGSHVSSCLYLSSSNGRC